MDYIIICLSESFGLFTVSANNFRLYTLNALSVIHTLMNEIKCRVKASKDNDSFTQDSLK